MKKLFAILIFASSMTCFGAERTLFTIEKSYNNSNIIVVNVQLNRDCRFVKTENGLLDYYWLMNRSLKKEIHPLIRSTVASRLTLVSSNGLLNSFKLRLNDLTEVSHDIADPTLEVSSELVNGQCRVRSVMTLGHSQKYRRIDLDRIYGEVDKNLMGVPSTLKYIDLDGKDVDNNESIRVRYRAK